MTTDWDFKEKKWKLDSFSLKTKSLTSHVLVMQIANISQRELAPFSDDVFAIDEVTMFEGEDWNEKKYAVAGDILDGHLYDLFMNMLEVRPNLKTDH